MTAKARASWRPAWMVLACLVLAGLVPREAAAEDGMVIRSDSMCPSEVAVRAALLGLRPAQEWPTITVSIRAKEHEVFVDLGATGTTPRPIAVAPDCDTRAATVALVIATWASELPAQTVTAPILQQEVVPRTEPATPGPALVGARPRHREMGVGLWVAGGGGFVPGIRAELVSLPGDRGLGWQASVVVPAARTRVVGGGTTAWMRPSAGMALLVRWAGHRLFLSGRAGVALGYTVAWGRDYASNQTEGSLTWGPFLGGRAGLAWKRVLVWSDLHGGRWLRSEQVQIDGDADSGVSRASLSVWDVQGALGVSYLF